MANDRILLGKGTKPVHLLARYGNRHGLVAGAPGTGKTVSLMVMAEGFSRLGVPVFMADVKGDVAGLAMPGVMNEKVKARVAETGVEGYTNEACPVVFWDVYGKAGHPVRTTVSEMGPSLLGRILQLNDTQSGVLEIAFKLADDRGLLLLDLDDLRALLGFVADNRKEISAAYGLVSAQSIAAIQRALLTLDREGGEMMFGEPALQLGVGEALVSTLQETVSRRRCSGHSSRPRVAGWAPSRRRNGRPYARAVPSARSTTAPSTGSRRTKS